MEMLGIAGFVFAATALSVVVYEHQTDVLHGPYIEGRVEPQWAAELLKPVRALADPVVDRIKWNARCAIYLAALA
jgi:hypothetical protein